ncbi:MAG: PAS domain-containing protein [Desulfobacterales bacterium]|nr:PAS domain-containing protein [Desulfobacterales bacterium]
MPCFVSVHDRDLTVVAANPLYRERLGDMVGRRSWEIYADRSDPAVTCPVGPDHASPARASAARRPSFTATAAGDPAMVHTVPIRNSRGELELVLEFAVDISEVERLREELRATQDRLTSLGLMVSSVSHGVKGILTGLDAGVYLTESGLRKPDLAQAREGLATVKEMVERVRRVVLDVLYFAKERPLRAQAARRERLHRRSAGVWPPQDPQARDRACSRDARRIWVNSRWMKPLLATGAAATSSKTPSTPARRTAAGPPHRIAFRVRGDARARDLRDRRTTGSA